MAKKDGFEEESKDMMDDELLDDIPDDILLNEDLDDPLLAEAEALLGIAKPGSKPKKNLTPKKTEEDKKSIQTEPKILKKAVISKQTMKEFTIFILKKAKIYEEIAFETILRKLNPAWNFTEPVLIDVLEAIIESNTVTAIKMKMTANSLKFYSATHPKDKKI
ncbi:hypothetical protein NEF87_002486 [Candidatus Lokiarchaeum ossiferum]|uniref:Uncharacterized protein n=1 Tax=Candidatus Lokiarchaeum ossiferum TaxID=2951803 RepID=A0ABY6HUF6_9ARCH|nr:hypothetical protein NEF87_002486 [Candidatus Lokiarchaeum sp. B-35]